MPFQSEKQRRYLWANEPKIARDWTDTYGSRVKKETGGITRIPFANGSGFDFFNNPYTKDIAGTHGKAMYEGPNAIVNTTPGGLDYHIRANADVSQRISDALKQSGNPITSGFYDLVAPAGALGSSLFYDANQAYNRMEPGSGITGFGKAWWDEDPFTAALGRTIGAAQPLANRFGGIWDAFKNEFGGSAEAATPDEYASAQGVDVNNIRDLIAKSNMQKMMNAPSSNVPQPFNQQYLEGSGWLNDARTADELSQLPIDALPNKRQKVTDFLSRFIPGGTVAKMLRPDANEAYGNVAGLYPEEVFGMQEFGSGEDLRTDPWGKNIVSFAGDYEQGIKDWVEKYGSRIPKYDHFAKKQAWKKKALAKIIKQEQAREKTKRAQVQAMSDQNRKQGVGGWDSGMARDEAFMTGEREEGQPLSDVMGSFNRGGLAALWPR